MHGKIHTHFSPAFGCRPCRAAHPHVILANDIDTGSRLNIGTTTGRTVTLTGARTGNGELWVHGTGTVVVAVNANNNWAKNIVMEGGGLQVSDLTRTTSSALGTGNMYFGQVTTLSTGAGLIYTGDSVSTDAFANIQSPYAFIDITNAGTVLSITNGFSANRPNAGMSANLLTKRGAGTLSFEGNLDAVRMRIQVDGGTLLMGKMDNTSVHTVANADALILNAGVVRITGNNGDQIYDPSTIQMNGGTLDLNGHDEAFDGFTASAAGAVITNTAAGTPSKLTLGANNGSSVYSGKLQDGAGKLALQKNGTGALTLAGTNTLTGGTSVTNGRLIVTGSLTGTTQVTGDSSTGTYVGGVLGGTGTVGGVVTFGGVVSPGTKATGAGLGTLKMGTLDMSANGTLQVAISTSTLEASLAQIQGDLNLGFSAAVLQLTDIGADVGIAGNPVFTIMSYTGIWDGGTFSYVGLGDLADNSTFVFGENTYRIDYDAMGATAGTREVTLTVVVPEPAVGGMFAVGLALLGLHRRRKSARSLPLS